MKSGCGRCRSDRRPAGGAPPDAGKSGDTFSPLCTSCPASGGFPQAPPPPPRAGKSRCVHPAGQRSARGPHRATYRRPVARSFTLRRRPPPSPRRLRPPAWRRAILLAAVDLRQTPGSSDARTGQPGSLVQVGDAATSLSPRPPGSSDGLRRNARCCNTRFWHSAHRRNTDVLPTRYRRAVFPPGQHVNPRFAGFRPDSVPKCRKRFRPRPNKKVSPTCPIALTPMAVLGRCCVRRAKGPGGSGLAQRRARGPAQAALRGGGLVPQL